MNISQIYELQKKRTIPNKNSFFSVNKNISLHSGGGEVKKKPTAKSIMLFLKNESHVRSFTLGYNEGSQHLTEANTIALI